MGDMTAIPKEKRIPLDYVEPTEKLVEAANEGCPDSIRLLVELHYKPLRFFLAKYINRPSDIDDLAQDVLITALNGLDRFSQKSSFSTWLMGIARNKSLEFLRKEKVTRQRTEKFFLEEVARRKLTRLELDTGSLADQSQQLAHLKVCLRELPARSKALIDRHYFEKTSAATIARDSDQKPNAIRMKLMRIRNVLRKCLQQKQASE